MRYFFFSAPIFPQLGPWWAQVGKLFLAVICLANLALLVPVCGEARDAVHLDGARVKSKQQRIYAELRPLFLTMLNNVDQRVRSAVLYAGAGIVRDKALVDILRAHKGRAEFPEVLFLNAFIAGATNAKADVAAFLDSLPDTYAGCEALYNLESALGEGLPLRLVEQAYSYVQQGGFSGLAEPKTIWGERFVLLEFLSGEATGHAESDARLQAWLAAHPDFYAEFQAQAERFWADRPDGVAQSPEDLPEKLKPLLTAISAFFDHPDPLVRLTAFRLAGRLFDPYKEMQRRLELAADSREKLLLYSQLSSFPFAHEGSDFTFPLAREYPQSKEDYTRLLEWEYIVYGDSLPSLACLADASEITRDSLAETRPVLRRMLPWAAPYLPANEAERYARIAAGKFIQGEFYQWSGRVLEVYSGDTLLVTANELGDTVKYRLNNADCPYAGQPYHQEALARAKELVLGQRVNLRSDGEDAFGRRVGWVEYGPHYESLAQTLISEGLAQAPSAESGKHANYYAVEEKAARDALNGIWSLDQQESPAAYRQRMLAETGIDPEAVK